jgi:hypothetical protein
LAAYLVQAIIEHRTAELDVEDLDIDDTAKDDPCVVLWAVLDRLALDPLTAAYAVGPP